MSLGVVVPPGAALSLVPDLERAGVDYAVIAEEGPGSLPPVLLAARLAPATSSIGLVAEADAASAEPFHLAVALATLDHVSHGRAGWSIGRTGSREGSGLAEAAAVVEAVVRLWDSWDDDAEIRDAATGRFLDRERLHRVEYESEFFRIAGPSITPRPPQGHLVVLADRATGLPHVDLGTEEAPLARILVDPADEDSVDEAVRRSKTEDVLLSVPTARAEELAEALLRAAPLRPSSQDGSGTLRERLGLSRPRSVFEGRAD